MAKKYIISLDPREASKIVRQYQKVVIEEHRSVEALSDFEKELFARFSCVIDSCLPHLKQHPVLEVLDDFEQKSESFEQYQTLLFDCLDNIEAEAKKYKNIQLLRECQPAIVELEADRFDDKTEYHEAVCHIVSRTIHQNNLSKTWQEYSQRLGHFMGKKIPFFEKERFEEEARDYFVALIRATYRNPKIDDELINFILQFYNVDNLSSVTSFLQDLYVQLDIHDFSYVQHYEMKRSTDCIVCEDGSLRFEFVAHYFPRHENNGLLMTERYVLVVAKEADEIKVSVEEVSISFYDDAVFKEFLIPVLSGTLKRISKKGYEISGVDKSLMRACAQYYWELKDAKSLREKLESGELDGERLFALAWDSNTNLSIILSDPLLLGQLCALDEHLALLQKLKDHTYNKSLKRKLSNLQKVLSKLKPKFEYELDSSDKETRIFMLAGMFGLNKDEETISFASSVISKKLIPAVNFNLGKWLGEEFGHLHVLEEGVENNEPEVEERELDPLVEYTKEISACNNSAVLAAKCHSAWEKDSDDSERVLLDAYVRLLKVKPETYIDSFLMLNPQVQAEMLKDARTVYALLKKSETAEKLLQDENLFKLMLETLKNEFDRDENLSLACLKILVDYMKKPMRGRLLRDKKWQAILFSLLLNDVSELPLIIKVCDKIERGFWLLCLDAQPKQLLYLMLSLHSLVSKLKKQEVELRVKISLLTQEAKSYWSEFNTENNAAKLIAQSAKLNDHVNINDAEAETNAHLENAKKLQAQHKEAIKQLDQLKSDLELVKQQFLTIDELKKIIEEKLKLTEPNPSPIELIASLYGYEDMETSCTSDEFIIKAFSDSSLMSNVLISGDFWDISPAVVGNANLEILAALVLVASNLNNPYLPPSFIRRLQTTEENIDDVLELFDACFVKPTWILPLFNGWENPPKKALHLFQKANEYLTDNFRVNRDFLSYLCKVSSHHLGVYLPHIKKTTVKDWVALLNQYENIDELVDLYVNLSQSPEAEPFCAAFLTQPFLDKVLLFASAKRINQLIDAKLDCMTRARELSVHDPIFRSKISQHAGLKEKIIENPDQQQFVALCGAEIDMLSSAFLGEWFIKTFAEEVNVFHTAFLKPPIVRRMLEASYNHTELRVLVVLIRALQHNSSLKDVGEITQIVENYLKAKTIGVALLEADAEVLLEIFQLNVKSGLARILRSLLVQSEELLLKLFIELDESSLVALVRGDTERFFVNWLVAKNHPQLLSRRLYTCERGSSKTNNSLIGCILANISLAQLVMLSADSNLCESVALQLSHTVGRAGTYPLLLGVLKSKVDKKKSSIVEFLKLFKPLNHAFRVVVSKQNNDLTNSAWSEFLKLTLVFILQAKLSYKDTNALHSEISATYHWKKVAKRVALVSEDEIYFPSPQLYFLLMILCKPAEVLDQFMDPQLGLKICAEFMSFSPDDGGLIVLSSEQSIRTLPIYRQFYEAAQVISSASAQQRKSKQWFITSVESIFEGMELKPEKIDHVARLRGSISENSEDDSNDTGGEVVYL